MFMDEVLGKKTKNEGVVWWKGAGVVKERTALFLLAPIIKPVCVPLTV